MTDTVPAPLAPYPTRTVQILSGAGAVLYPIPIGYAMVTAACDLVMLDCAGNSQTYAGLPAYAVLAGPFAGFTSVTTGSVILSDRAPLMGAAQLPAATSTVPGSLSAADKRYLDSIHSPAGAALTDAAVTITVSQGSWRTLPAATLSANRILTLGTAGAVAGDILIVTRLDLGAYTFAIANGGVGAGTLFTMAVSKAGFATCQFDGTNWALKTFGVQ